MNSWEGKILLKAGKDVLIKSLPQAIPTYTMSVFQLPIGTKRLIVVWPGSGGVSLEGRGFIGVNGKLCAL